METTVMTVAQMQRACRRGCSSRRLRCGCSARGSRRRRPGHRTPRVRARVGGVRRSGHGDCLRRPPSPGIMRSQHLRALHTVICHQDRHPCHQTNIRRPCHQTSHLLTGQTPLSSDRHQHHGGRSCHQTNHLPSGLKSVIKSVLRPGSPIIKRTFSHYRSCRCHQTSRCHQDNENVWQWVTIFWRAESIGSENGFTSWNNFFSLFPLWPSVKIIILIKMGKKIW